MVRDISGAGGNQTQIKRVSVRSNGAGHATAGVAVGSTPPVKPALVVKDVASIKNAATTIKSQR